MVTVIYPFRDVDPGRLRDSIISIKKNNTERCSFIVVDYGSSPEYIQKLIEICKNENVEYIRSETEGLPWSRAHSLNIGILKASTEFVIATDIDMIFGSNIIDTSLQNFEEKSVIHCLPTWLPKSGIKMFAKTGCFSDLGGYVFLKKKDFIKIGGFDERIKFWGHEDFDLENRLNKAGFKTIWLKSQKLYHVWHKRRNIFTSDRPESSKFDTLKVTLENSIHNKKNDDFGGIIKKEERPILDLIGKRECKNIEVINYEKEILEIIKQAQKEEFVKLKLPRRRKVSYFGSNLVDESFVFWDKVIFNRLGYNIQLRKDPNFDLFYLSLPLLKHEGLRDYYMNENHEEIYLLF